MEIRGKKTTQRGKQSSSTFRVGLQTWPDILQMHAVDDK